MTQASRSFVPAAGHDWLLPLYDPVQWLMGGERARAELIAQAGLEAGQRVLDLGCGTGDLVVAVGRAHPDVDVVGLDPDPKALARARAKVDRAGLSLALDEGFADALPYPDGSFDRVFSSFMFHHLPTDVKRGALDEVRRVLQPGGSLHLLDFGGSETHAHGLLARLLHRADHLHDNLEGRVPALMEAVGFEAAAEVGHRRTLFGPIAYFRASVPLA